MRANFEESEATFLLGFWEMFFLKMNTDQFLLLIRKHNKYVISQINACITRHFIRMVFVAKRQLDNTLLKKYYPIQQRNGVDVWFLLYVIFDISQSSTRPCEISRNLFQANFKSVLHQSDKLSTMMLTFIQEI